MSWVFYLIITLIATTAGAATGMGGGIIIKPVLDMFGDFDVKTIGILSSITVLAMSLVSVGRQIHSKKIRLETSIALPLAIGSVLGGYVGNLLLNLIAKDMQGNTLTAVQNIALGLLIALVFIYMQKKSSTPKLKKRGAFAGGATGVSLGIISSFLGIGGGPINVAVLIFMFGFSTKTAALYSLIAIIFSQLSKLANVLVGEGFAQYNLSMLPLMLVGSIVGGFLGTYIQHKIPDKKLTLLFNSVQILVFAFCIYNVCKNL